MDLFKRELAPLSKQAWAAIEERTKEVLLSRLSARSVVKVEGPKGIAYAAVNTGRLNLIDDGEVKTGVYTLQPLTEARIRFSLNKWELDNLIRGAKDIDFENLDNAVEKLALFEENAVYNGYAKASIKGLKETSAHKSFLFGTEANEILTSLTEGLLLLKKHFIHGPYALVVSKDNFLKLNKEYQGVRLIEQVEHLLGSKVVLATSLEGALMIPFNSEHLELTIGQDFALGYESHDSKEVTLFITESFTFRVMEPKSVIVYQ
ncbi:MAG: family 1 encapsulin nanocompartment shell protein [Sphaerochaeta sp.]|jgi:uncharacterized linocin/CFP29 family protein|uniref:family 1 encapsulin nanocompartment shell protein n=1 Tax=Sphaerochaeta sp. TaxID=1972642 RepID=UPI002FC5F608